MKHTIKLLAALVLLSSACFGQSLLLAYNQRFENNDLYKRIVGSFIIAADSVSAESSNTANYVIRQRIVQDFWGNPQGYVQKQYTAVIGILQTSGQLANPTDAQINTAVSVWFTRQVNTTVVTGLQE